MNSGSLRANEVWARSPHWARHGFQARAKPPGAPKNSLGSHIRDPDHPLVCAMGPISYLLHLLQTNPGPLGSQ